MIRIKTNIIPSSRSTLVELFDKIKDKLDENKEYRVFITDDKETRTTDQNKYYWGVVLPLIAAEIGLKKDEAHELLKYKFNTGAIYDPEADKVIEIPLTTTGMSIADFIEYIERCKQWANTFLGVIFPETGVLPDELLINNQ